MTVLTILGGILYAKVLIVQLYQNPILLAHFAASTDTTKAGKA